MDSILSTSFLRHIAQTSPNPDGFEVKYSKGIYLFDPEDNPFIDCISGIAVSSLGHSHPRIHSAISKQLERYTHTMVYGEHIQPIQVNLAKKLAELLPENLSVNYFTNSGAEAVEGALKLARKSTNRYEIIACRNAYHGSTAGAESLRSDLHYTAFAKPLVPGIRHIGFNSFEDIAMINERTAAVIVEPIQAEAGVVIPAPGFLKAVRNRCNQTGTLLIFDEIQTGMGRTGSMWAFEQENVVPDILLLAKAFGGGLPLGAFISSPEIMSALSHNPILGHMTTFGGHPLSCAASLEALQIVLDDQLQDRAIALGDLFKAKLKPHPALQEIRGRGLMLALN
jgi:acetylornithine/succinyldiaminopimelate/putrescine aminotransferase